MEKTNYQLDTSELIEKYESNMEKGLTADEFNLRLEKYGPNKLTEKKKRSLLMRFWDQLNDFMIYVLLGAAAISIILALVNDNPSEIFEGLLILTIVIVNAVLGIVQEGKAEKALDSIKKMSSPHAKVLRDGIEIVVSVEDIVVGDIVLLNAGDIVPADLRILESHNLQIDESALTGESVPVIKISETINEKELPLGDQANLAFSSTVVTYGRGVALVIGTSMNTEIGKIAGMIDDAVASQTPLQKNINKLGKMLAIIALAIVGAIFVIDIIQSIMNTGGLTGETILESFMTAIALAVAAIPEGLPAIITIVLALGMRNLANRHAIMKTLPAVETLGSTSVICSDKTGTLTQNVMTITEVYTNDKVIEINEDEQNDYSHIGKLVKFGVLNNDTTINFIDNEFQLIGDPTEKALVDLAIATNYNPIDINKDNKRVYEFSFDSERKLMTTINEIDGKTYVVTKGAPDVMFNLVKDIEGTSTIEDYTVANLNMANKALRVLAIGYKEIPADTDFTKLTPQDVEKDLTLVGMYGMIDPARPEVKDAIALCYNAGITTVMITGDHKNTAIAIAKDLNIIQSDEDLALTGLELDQLSDEEFLKVVDHVKVYARVSPENKVRIVNTWQKRDVVVAMTGDGVNDAPALKNADIGIAMGITGTEVAKGASDMILTDDNFGTIVEAVSEGRSIFENIKKAIHFLLSCNIGEILTILLGTLIGGILFSEIVTSGGNVHILSAVQILWVNLVTDSLMAIALGLDPKNPDIMDHKPRSKGEGVFSNGLWKHILWQGIMVGLLAFVAYFIGYTLADSSLYQGQTDAWVKAHTGQTMAFMVLALSQLFHAFNVRSTKLSISKLKVNKFLIYAFFASLTLQSLTLLPGVRNIFDIIFIKQAGLWGIIFLLAFSPVIVTELVKFFIRLADRRKETKLN